MTDLEIPASLRRWFAVHALVDLLVGLPLLIAPETLLHSLGWVTVDPPSARLVGAALLAIGGQSWFGRKGGVQAYRAMLDLKLLWSGGAILGLGASLGAEHTPGPIWIFLAVFIAFFGIWFYYRIRMKQLGRMRDLPDDPDPIDETDEPDGQRHRPGDDSPN
jgi:hypothetical protein